MADLPPSLSSEDEIEIGGNNEDNDNDTDGDEVDTSFEFGGILGEDGGVFAPSGVEGWSYQSALKSIQSESAQSAAHPRMDVASIIAAKRKAIKQSEKQQEIGREKGDADAPSDSEKSTEEINDDGSDSDSDSSSSDSDEEDDNQVDDANQEMEEDMLKIRTGKDREGNSKHNKIDNENSDHDDDDDDDKSDSDSDKDEADDASGSHEDDDDDSDDEDKEEALKAAKFFDNQPVSAQSQRVELFVQLNLSRPLLRGVAAMGFVKPTPIQAACLPVALSGRDICASAVTGSGKTAAFTLPILERLLHRTSGSTRALILTPTRELAAQCLGMLSTFAQFTKIRTSLVVGGTKNVNAQAAELRSRPDVIVATPGRLCDHLTNTPGFVLSDIEFLVLDEADKVLSLGFQDEVKEIIKSCPVTRQSLLFSATMNTKVDDLISLSLKRPVRIRISDKRDADVSNKDLEVAPHLEQEFVRIRSGNEGINREAILLALLTRTFQKQTIVFFDTKAAAHRLMILCGLCGIKCAELHGNLTQTQRLDALQQFREGEVDVLLATDLAARGLDIHKVDAVVNFEMPSSVETYIHRIGRTARAGRGGTACTMIGEGRRHLMKVVIKDAAQKNKRKQAPDQATSRFETGVIRSRSVPSAVVTHFVNKIRSLQPHLKEVLQAEAVARLDRLADMEAAKAQNIIQHSGEIMKRPQREWITSNKQKQLTKEAMAEKHKMIAEKAGSGTHRMTRKKRRAREALEALNAPDEDDDGSNEILRPDHSVLMKTSARATKRKMQEKEREEVKETISEKLNGSKAIPERKKKKRKAAEDAIGESSLFNDDNVLYSKSKPLKEEDAVVKSSFDFHGGEPMKRRGKKKSVNKFKSKSKYKRR